MHLQDNEKENRRATMLEQVEQLISEGKSVFDACVQANVPRSQFYKWRSRRDGDPAKGLRDLSRRAVEHSSNVSKTEKERICELSLEFLKEGCDRLKARLEDEGIRRSSTTIQKVLRQNGLGSFELRQGRKNQDLERLIVGMRRQLHRLPRRRARSKSARLYESYRALLKPGESVLQGFYEIAWTHSASQPPNRRSHLSNFLKLYLHFIFDFPTELVWFDLIWAQGIEGTPSACDTTDVLASNAIYAFRGGGVAVDSLLTSNHPAFVKSQHLIRPGTFGPSYPFNYGQAVASIGLKHMVIKEEAKEEKVVVAYVFERLRAEFPDQNTLTWFLNYVSQTNHMSRFR